MPAKQLLYKERKKTRKSWKRTIGKTDRGKKRNGDDDSVSKQERNLITRTGSQVKIRLSCNRIPNFSND